MTSRWFSPGMRIRDRSERVASTLKLSTVPARHRAAWLVLIAAGIFSKVLTNISRALRCAETCMNRTKGHAHVTKTGELTFACGDYEIMRALKEGIVRPEGIELTVLTDMAPSPRHWRFLRGREFDVAEVSGSGYVAARDQDLPFRAIPVFPIAASVTASSSSTRRRASASRPT